ncbi:MAG: DUF4254 domain-containing protein [Bacteroidetes bacterium]|nr:DUF4254 domain-containing protein [Bacteroidota bacterium]
MVHSTKSISAFNKANDDYHAAGKLMPEMNNPHDPETIEHLLYMKGWIDAVQWHLEDEVRNPEITPDAGWNLKKHIDNYNHRRTHTVEAIDLFIFEELHHVKHSPDAYMNSETPGWILDRLSILGLRIYHMKEEAHRHEAGSQHVELCHDKLSLLMEQEEDLSTALDQLMADLTDGKKYMKLYYQMKMYNDETLNPVLYKSKK